MKFVRMLPAIACVCLCASAIAKPAVVTFSNSDLERLMAETCNQAPSSRGGLHAHRNSQGNMLYIVSEDHSEAVVWGNSQQCNELSTDTLDLWREDKGNAVAQLILKDERRMLMVGEFDPVRGKRFDIDRSGQYLVISHGTSSTLGAVNRPYRTMLNLQLDAQRIFVRKRTLLIVGGNPLTGRMEARVVRVSDTGMTEDAPIPINMPAGVQVLDYSEATDDLLLGGVDASGQTAFAIYSLENGQSSAVTPNRPGDNQALFMDDKDIRNRLTGKAGPGEQQQSSPAAKR